MERKLNLNIAERVSELETLIKKVLPRDIMYRLLLGKGLEFDGYRDFTQSDDASMIDWKASVRSKNLLVKKYIEERDLKFLFLIDVSDNMIFGSTEKLKCEYVAELTAAVSHLILTNGDRFGYTFYNDEIVKMNPPEFGTKTFEVFVHRASSPEIYGGISNLNKVLENLIKTLDRGISMVFIISDFIKVDDSYKKNLEILAGLFETVSIIVRDPLDNTFPDIGGEIVIQDPGSGEKLLINPKVAKKIYEKNSMEQLNRTKKIFTDYNIDFLDLSTDEPFAPRFAQFLSERIKGGRVVKLKNVY